MQNIRKLSLDEFNEIRDKLYQLRRKIHKKGGNPSKDYSKYIMLEKTLFSCDLSDIPFESYAWMEFFNEDELLDFSNTHANLDFALIKVRGFGNYVGCNVRNVEKLGLYKIKNSKFDDNARINNSECFLSDKFSKEFEDKFYDRKITIKDLSLLSLEQIQELKNNKLLNECFSSRRREGTLLKGLGIEIAVKLYKNHKADYEYIRELLNSQFIIEKINQYHLFYEIAKEDISKARELCNRYVREIVLSPYFDIDERYYPDSFVRENNDLFMTNINMPDDLRKRYYKKRLSIRDLLDNMDILENTDIKYFFREFSHVAVFAKKIGSENFINLVKKYRPFFEYICGEYDYNGFSDFIIYYKHSDNYEEAFVNAVKKYAISNKIIRLNRYSYKDKYEIPDFLSSFNFKIVVNYKNMEDMSTYDCNTILMNNEQRRMIEVFGLNNLIRFDKKTNLFSYRDFNITPDGKKVYEEREMSRGWRNLRRLASFLSEYSIDFDPDSIINNYEEFEDKMAKFLERMKNKGQFAYNFDYDIIEGDFREKYKHMFIDKNVPANLRSAFYMNNITPALIKEHREYIWALADKDLSKIIDGNFMVHIYDSYKERIGYVSNDFRGRVNLIEFYSKMFGNMELLKLMSIYGSLFSDLYNISFRNDISKEQLNKKIRYEIYCKIENNYKIGYKSISNPLELGGDPEFTEEFPGIFIDEDNIPIDDPDDKEAFITNFYNRSLTFDTFYNKPELANYLKDKNMAFIFSRYREKRFAYNTYDGFGIREKTEIDLINILGDEKFLILCSKYGRYLEKFHFDSKAITPYTLLEEICRMIEHCIYENCLEGITCYNPEDAPKFMLERHHDLFLSEDAPDELKEFYYYGPGWNLKTCFLEISKHKEWLPYLKGKHYKALILKTLPSSTSLIKSYNDYFDWLGEEAALEFGIKKPETVYQMIVSFQVATMMEWYGKTGYKFIPDYVVMQSFPIEKIDKFLESTSDWSRLMSIKNFSATPEGRDALLKLAYSFGVFDHDKIGMKKLEELLTGLPRHISSDEYKKLTNLELEVKNYENYSFKNEKYDYINKTIKDRSEVIELMNRLKSSPSGYDMFVKLRDELLREGIILSKEDSVIDSLFRKNDDGTITLKVNIQGKSKVRECLRTILENKGILLNRDDAHRLFGGFELKYDKDFREFLLANLDEIRRNPEYTSYVSNIQKQFSDIKIFNSNRHLTLDLAISFIKQNKYQNINPGNEKVAEISAIAGYSQDDFNTLQMIYNYGKQRVFSSIPRIEKKIDDYYYEMLRLDDPLAMAIGTLTNCCQELGNAAEVCMEHSMVDKNGRIFIIKDKLGNIMAQSWVWRNGNVICFDNVEIPDRAFARVVREKSEVGKKEFANIIYDLYKKASEELLEEDERIYKKLLEEGKVTKEGYDYFRLKKVTVGLGYNDIAEAIKKHSYIDKSSLSMPLPFYAPVKLSRSLYTNDSTTQYVLKEIEDRPVYKGEIPLAYSDTFVVYDDNNFSNSLLFALKKLEIITDGDEYSLYTDISDYESDEKIVSSIASNYRLNPGVTRIVMNANFAIIYEDLGSTIRIGDLFYNTSVDNGIQKMDITDSVIMQIKVAIDQISGGKSIDVTMLSKEKRDIYNKVINLDNTIDNFRGYTHRR